MNIAEVDLVIFGQTIDIGLVNRPIGCSGKRVESSLIMQWNSLRSSEFFRNLVKGATFCLGQANPGESEGKQSCSHEEEVNICAADFLCERRKHVSHHLKDLCSVQPGRRPETELTNVTKMAF